MRAVRAVARLPRCLLALDAAIDSGAAATAAEILAGRAAVPATTLRDDLRAALNDGTRKVVAFTDQIGCADAVFASDGFDPFFNVNTPDDMDTATKILRDHPVLADPAMAQG